MRWMPLSVVLLSLGLAACMQRVEREPPRVVPVIGARATVTDLAAFQAFIATRPTPGAFREAYPGVTLVLPGDIATKELRMDNSRYFATLDEAGRIVGGRFQ